MRTNTSLQFRKKERILELRGLNYTYREIQEAIPGLSKGSIAYHCGEGQKEKTLNNQKRRKEGIQGKVFGFHPKDFLKREASKEKEFCPVSSFGV